MNIGASDTDTKGQSSGETCDRLGLPNDVRDWSVGQVQTWAMDQGFDYAPRLKMIELQVDGDVLLHIEPADIQKDLGVISGTQAKRLFSRIKALHEHHLLHARERAPLVRPVQPLPPPPISTYFPVLARACLCRLGAPNWVLTSLRACNAYRRYV